MPYIGRIPPKPEPHRCATPWFTIMWQKEGALWQCPKCDQTWKLTAVQGALRNMGGPLIDLVWRTYE